MLESQSNNVVEKLTYIIFIISYTISLLDFVTLSCVQFLEFDFDFNYIYISRSSSYSLYIDFTHSFCTFVLYTFIFIFIIVATRRLHNVCIHHIAIYSLMNSSYCIQLSHLIVIFNICCHYL